MPQLGGPELIIVLLIALVVFGVGHLAEVGDALGRSVREFRRALRSNDEDPTDHQSGEGKAA